MQNLKVSIFQSDIIWHNPEKNLEKIGLLLENSINEHSQLLILPEMFTTGFSMNTNLAEKMNGKTLEFLIKNAQKFNIAISGSIIIEENNQYFNRHFFVFPSGEYQFYDKRHLFRMAKEHEVYTAGNNRVIVDYLGWKIALFTCYDLRFPVWSRNQNDYELALYVANWPQRRIKHWQTLLRARAIENQSFVIGVNRVGTDGNEIIYDGKSAIIDALGETIVELSHNEMHITVELNKTKMLSYREKFPAWQDADNFTVR